MAFCFRFLQACIACLTQNGYAYNVRIPNTPVKLFLGMMGLPALQVLEPQPTGHNRRTNRLRRAGLGVVTVSLFTVDSYGICQAERREEYHTLWSWAREYF
jgi:hypothetical protein